MTREEIQALNDEELQNKFNEVREQGLELAKSEDSTVEDITESIAILEMIDEELANRKDVEKSLTAAKETLTKALKMSKKFEAEDTEEETEDSEEEETTDTEEETVDTEEETTEDTEEDAEEVEAELKVDGNIEQILEASQKTSEDTKNLLEQFLEVVKDIKTDDEKVEVEVVEDAPLVTASTTSTSIGDLREGGGKKYGSFADLTAAAFKASRNANKGTDGEIMYLASMPSSKSEFSLKKGEDGLNLKAIQQLQDKVSTEEGMKASLACCVSPEVARDLPSYCDSSSGIFRPPVVNIENGGLAYQLPSNACGFEPETFTWKDCEIDPETGETIPVDNAENEKPCQIIEGCPEDVKLIAEARGWCFEYGNADAMFNPEFLEYWIGEALCKYEFVSGQANLQEILDDPRITTQACALPKAGLFGDIFQALGVAADQIRADLCAGNLRLDVWLPSWLEAAIAIDNIRRGSTGGLGLIGSELNLNINPLIHWQPLSNSTDCTYPDAAQILIAAPGSIIEGDAGELNFGLVRDSQLNSKNKVRLAYEKFGAVGFIGADCAAKILELTDLCANGAVGPRVDACA